jgi:predicted PurR-regulated permease PerM
LQEALYVIKTEGRQWSRAEKVAYIKDRLSGTLLGTALERLTNYMKTDEFNKLLINAAKGIGVGGWTALTFVVNTLLGLTGLIIVLLYLIFLLVDFPHYERTWKSLLPPAYRDSITGFLEEFQLAMRRYFRGQFVIALCMAVLFTIGFTLIGLPMAVPMGLFMGLLNMVPYLQIVGLVPATALALLGAVQGDSSAVWAVVWLFVVVGVAQLMQDAIITPRVMRRATGLKPVAILLGVFIWGKLLGFLGLILAIPLTCLGIAYYRRYVLEHSPEETKPVTE